MNNNFLTKKQLLTLFLCSPVLLLSTVNALAQLNQVVVEDPTHEEEEGHIELTQEQIEYAGIGLAEASGGSILDLLPAYGVVKTNAERVQKVSARFDGIIRNITKSIGDPIRQGEPLLTIEANESLRNYSIDSALSGVVTQRDANVGERAGERILLVVEDFSTVWVELSVFPKDITSVTLGQETRIRSLDGAITGQGKVIYIAPYGSSNNQAVSVRALVSNPGGQWKPGHFISAELVLNEVTAALVIENQAIQIIDGETTIFVKGDDGFEPRIVSLGRTDGRVSELLAGLSVGETYVSKNSFVLKSELGKEDAEHGH